MLNHHKVINFHQKQLKPRRLELVHQILHHLLQVQAEVRHQLVQLLVLLTQVQQERQAGLLQVHQVYFRRQTTQLFHILQVTHHILLLHKKQFVVIFVPLMMTILTMKKGIMGSVLLPATTFPQEVALRLFPYLSLGLLFVLLLPFSSSFCILFSKLIKLKIVS